MNRKGEFMFPDIPGWMLIIALFVFWPMVAGQTIGIPYPIYLIPLFIWWGIAIVGGLYLVYKILHKIFGKKEK